MLIISGILLCVLAGLAKGVQDTVAHHYSISIFKHNPRFKEKFWDAKKSWINKWDYSSGVRKERFPGSSTIFVALTDAWHLAQLVNLNLLVIGAFLIGVECSMLWMVVGVICYRSAFEISYRWIYVI